MITINVKTKAVKLDADTPEMARNQFGNATYGYVRGWIKPNYPVPALPYVVKRDYMNDRLIGLMLGATNRGLLCYWPLGYSPIETIEG